MLTMERKTAYRVLLLIVVLLAVVYTLGIVGLVPFRWSEYITLFMVLLFILLRINKGSQA
ncbi:hypothetical protein [Thermococcus sp.]|uniref:hypothetical protein n=1 Tax=Thermococcus sp. TaxID=35749 RepID=UPI002608D9A4|nr:hypothetical protein [Thermococcus sp.]